MDWKQKMEQIAENVRNSDDFVVIHHYDADGCSSGAILYEALRREGKKVQKMWIKQLYRENIPEIKGKGKNYVFVDFGSGQLEYLIEEFGKNLFVFDHHQKVNANHENHFSPFDFGINGGNEISASGIAYLFAKTLNPKNIDLVPLAIVGAVGDVQDFSGKLIGLNAEIVKDGIHSGFLKVENDLRLYGRITRPLVQFLLFSSSPVLPNLTANEENCLKFLQETGIQLKRGEVWRTYSDLNPEEKKTLTTALILHLHNHNVPEWKIKELIGEVYSFPHENQKRPVSDAKEFSTLLNACGRHGMAEVGVEVCLGDRGEKYLEAMALMQEHRRQLREGIEFIAKNGVQEEEMFYCFDSGETIKESIVGIVAGMLYGSGIIGDNKPIIAIAHNEDGSLKISGRATKDILYKGINLGKAFKEICAELGEGNEGGGHCLHPFTLIEKENGIIKEIGTVEPQEKLMGKNRELLKGTMCTETFVSEKKELVKIKTPIFEIFASKDHRFFKFKDFKVVEEKVQKLQKGDFLLCVKKTDFTGRKIELHNDPFVYLAESGIMEIKNRREMLGLSRQQVVSRSGTVQRGTLYDIETMHSHRILKSKLVKVLNTLELDTQMFLQKYSVKQFACNSDFLNKEIAWLIGYIQADGYIDRKRVECKEPDAGIIKSFEEKTQESFSLKTRIIDNGTYKKLRVYSADLCRFFERNFPETKLLSGTLRVPRKIMVGENSILAYYLRGLFDGDGGVYDRFVYLDMIDENFLRTVQMLLLRFGIVSNLRKMSDITRLDITDFDSVKRFKENINFSENSAKHTNIQEIIKKQENKKRNSNIFSPVTYKQMRGFIIKNKIDRKIFDYKTLYRRTGKKHMSYPILKNRFIEPMLNNIEKFDASQKKQINELNSLVNSENFVFYKITKKETRKNDFRLIDLSVPENENFMANGFIVHNSIAAGLKLQKENKKEFMKRLNQKFKEQTNAT